MGYQSIKIQIYINIYFVCLFVCLSVSNITHIIGGHLDLDFIRYVNEQNMFNIRKFRSLFMLFSKCRHVSKLWLMLVNQCNKSMYFLAFALCNSFLGKKEVMLKK